MRKMTAPVPRVLIGWVLLAAACIGCIIAARLLLEPRPPIPTVVDTAAAPSATKPPVATVQNYSVAADLPKYISISSLNIPKSRIRALGTTADNKIQTPDNIYDAGWYAQSAKPGKAGAMFIFGHVSNWQAEGIFYGLTKIKSGDTITVTAGDDTNYIYKVAATKTYPHDKVPMDTVLSPYEPGRPGLNLMTCSGTILQGTSEFSERFVVFSTLVPSD